MDVHKESISIAVMNAAGKIVMECVIETKASTILQFIGGLRGDLQVTFEEGTCAAWLHDLLKPHVTEVVVCNPRRIALLKDGSKSDRIDARKLAELLYMNKLNRVYHGEHGIRTLKELARSYLTITKDLTRVMNRLKALYRSWGVPCAGTEVYSPRHRAEWLGKITEIGVRRRAEHYYQQLDGLRLLRQEVRLDLLVESKKHKPWKLLRQIPGIGPIGATVLVMKTPDPHAFLSGRHFAAWLGLTPKDHSTAGKTRLGKITRAGDERLRSVLVAGATAVIQQAKHGRGHPSPWVVALLKRKPPKLAAVALANKLARIAWKLMATGESYDGARVPSAFVA